MSAPFGESQSPRVAGIWHSLNIFLAVLIFFGVLAGIGYRFLSEGSKPREQLTRVEELKMQIEKEEQLLARNTREAEMLVRDPAFIDLIARDRLDLMKEGERVYRLSGKPAR